MDFDKKIILEVRDKASRALEKVNRVTEKISRTIQAVEKRTRRVRSANRAWENGIARIRKAYQGVAKIMARIIKLAKAAVRPVAATVGALAGGALLGVQRQSKATAQDAARAESLGFDLNIFNRLTEFLTRASSGLLDRDTSIDLLRDIIERQQEARQEVQRGEDFNKSSNTAIEGLRNLGFDEADLSAAPAQFVDKFLAAFRDESNASFLGRELASDVGDALSVIAKKTPEQIRKIEADILRTLPEINADDVKNARDFNTAWRNLQSTLSALLRQVLTPLTPVLERIVSGVGQKVQQFVDSGAADRFATAIGRITNAIIDLLPNVENVAENVAQRIEQINKFVSGGTVKPPTDLIKRKGFVQQSLDQVRGERITKQRTLIDDRSFGTNALAFLGLGSGLGLEDAKKEVKLLREREMELVEVLGKLGAAIQAKTGQIQAVRVPQIIATTTTAARQIPLNTGPEPIGP